MKGMDSATLRDIKAVVNDWYGIELTNAQVEEILSVPSIRGEVDEFGVFDTETRSKIGNYLARKIVGRPWPLNGDDQVTRDEFWEKLRTNGKTLGYKVHPTE